MKKTLLLLLTLMCSVGMWAAKYELVTSASQLVAGCNYIIADGTSGSVNVISTESNNNNRKTTTATVTNSSITLTDAMMVFSLGGSSNAWTFTTTNYKGTDGYLYNSSTSDNRLFVGNNTTYNKFTISFSNNTVSSITCNGNTSKGVMCFNGTLVACYASKSSTYKVPQLYKEVTGGGTTTEYEVTVSDDIQNGKVTVNLSKAEEGATISLTATPDKGYKFEAWNVTNASTSVAITVTDNKFTMPAANVNVSATFVEKPYNPNEIVYDFNDENVYPAGFPTKTGTKASAKVFNIAGNDLIINAPDAYYIINSTTENRGLFFGKTTAANNKPTEGTAYLGFPAIQGKKLVKVVATTTNGVAGSVKMNIYTTDWTAKSTELSTTTSTKKEFEFTLSNSAVNTEYRLASGSSGKNLQFDKIVLTYEKTDVDVTVNSCRNASFSCAKALDFTEVEGVKAYMVTAESSDAITLTEIKKVPANTGIFVLGEGGTYNIPVLEGDADDASANKLTATTEPKTVTASDNIWALSKNDGKLHPVTSGTIAAGKAYLVSEILVAEASKVRGFIFDDGVATGINTVSNATSNKVAYNLAGQRVAANAKGIVIMNGKKYINK